MDCSNNQPGSWMRRPQMSPPYRNTNFSCTPMQTTYPMPRQNETNFSMTPCMSSERERVSNMMPPASSTWEDMDRMPIGMGYVPWQRWGQTYSLEQGFERGTIFPELDYPFMGGVRNDAWS